MSIVSPATTLERLAQQRPDAPAVVVGEHAWSRAAVSEQERSLAAVLAGLGVGPGDRVAVLRRNATLHLTAFAACARLGAIFVPVNFRLPAAEAARVLHDARPAVVICGPRHAEQVETVLTRFPQTIWVVDDADPVTGEPAVGLGAHWLGLAALPGRAGTEPDPAPVPGEQIAMLQYTSGSTGDPKGVCLTYGNLEASWQATAKALSLGPDEVVLSVAPFGHVGGFNALTLQTVLMGGTDVIQRQFDAGRSLLEIERHRVTAMFGVPAMYQAMAAHPDFAPRDLRSVRAALAGGAPMPVPLTQRYLDHGVGMVVSWGMTELCGGGSFLPKEEFAVRAGSVGLPGDGLAVRVVDERSGAEVAEGEVGELVVRGPSVTPGYWRRERSAEDFTEHGWFRTGDLARRDADGYLYLAGRCKDTIISGGENIRPAEIENLLVMHPEVARVAVVGAPDPRWGECPVAVIEPRPGCGTPSVEQVRDFLAPDLARFKMPRRVVSLPQLPLGVSGKIDYVALRRLVTGVPE